MSKFKFQCTDDDGATTTVEFESEIWSDAFPKFLDLMRGSGFVIAEGTALYSPNTSEHLFGDRDYLIFDSDFEKCDCIKESTPTNPCCEVSKGDFEPCVHMDEDEHAWPFPAGVVAPNEDEPPVMTLERWMAQSRNSTEPSQHSDCYYDCNRNK